MKKSRSYLSLILILAMFVCLIPSAAANPFSSFSVGDTFFWGGIQGRGYPLACAG